MIILLFTTQLALPLFLIAWIAIAPSSNRLGFWVQAYATATTLFMLWAAGLWIFPPWWAPYAYAGVLFVAICVGLCRRLPFRSVLPMNIRGRISTAAFFALGSYAAIQAGFAVIGRTVPDVEVVDLSFPFEHGTYLVASGGSDLHINPHMKVLDASVPRFQKWRGNAYAVDLVKLDRWGFRSSGLQPSDPGAYYIYGTPVLAPCDGEVIVAVEGLPDMRVPEHDLQHTGGNRIILRGAQADVVLAHFQPGSLQVVTGDRVHAGQVIARVGNSGRSDEPHLHIHAQRPGSPDAPMSGDPLPIRFRGKYPVRNDRIINGDVGREESVDIRGKFE